MAGQAAAHLLIGGIGRESAHVARRGDPYARDLPEAALRAPVAAEREIGDLAAGGIGAVERPAGHQVALGGGDRLVAAGQGGGGIGKLQRLAAEQTHGGAPFLCASGVRTCIGDPYLACPAASARPHRRGGKRVPGCAAPGDHYIAGSFPSGEVAEWLKAHAWKACIRETVSRVRIPLSPPGEGSVRCRTASGCARLQPMRTRLIHDACWRATVYVTLSLSTIVATPTATSSQDLGLEQLDSTMDRPDGSEPGVSQPAYRSSQDHPAIDAPWIDDEGNTHYGFTVLRARIELGSELNQHFASS
jgi:hypothetical protein